MKEEISSGGVVVFGNAILLLRKYNGDWVLPKGKLERGENIEDAAIREVMEETNVKALSIKYLGYINYKFRSSNNENKFIDKTVHWYLMRSKNMNTVPQKSEGFIEASFIHVDRVKGLLKHKDERKIIEQAIKEIKGRENENAFFFDCD